MGRLAPRAIFIFVIALGIAVAAPLHALAMYQPCAQMTAQMTMDGPVTASMGQADQTMAGGGDSGSNLTESGNGALASMDCAQHCSNQGTAEFVLSSARHLANAPHTSGVSSFKPVFPELDPSPPRPGTAS